ncbi:MAG: CocE/NonD family hydrolase [marine benthic group bacterium]|nr:CocE/NonD family hydrolase [Gemmatimonadota bacterium]
MRSTGARARISLSLVCLSLLTITLFSTSSTLAQQAAPGEEDFVELIRTGGIAAATERFRVFREANPEGQIFRARTLNDLGYEFLRTGDTETAVAVFALNAEAYPDNDNAAAYLHILENYEKREVRIPMRDGVKLFTQIYAPKDRSTTWPILLKRTPYGIGRYGPTNYYPGVGPNLDCYRDGYIFVYQDVRGRYMSEGLYDNMRPHVPGDGAIDESSDTWDTIEWLLANLQNHNGKVGMWGTSYPGFYVTAAIPEAHPALVASMPQAPIADFYFDDLHHHGAFTLPYWILTPLTGVQKDGPETDDWWQLPQPDTRDAYQFYLELGPLKNSDRWFGEENFFWKQLREHPDYDEFWQARNILPHLEEVDHAVLTVGGWFDAEDLYGPLNIYRTLERNNPGIYNVLVMGPWQHGGWNWNRSPHMVGDIYYGDDISGRHQREVEATFFRHFLKGEGEAPAFEALVFDTGRKEWQAFDAWPPSEARNQRLYLGVGEGLSADLPEEAAAPFTEYVSDPNEPVPYTDRIRFQYTPRRYMNEDQRFADRRPDVISFQTEVLDQDLTLAGEILAHLEVSTSGTDSDWVVKLIDVYPDDMPDGEHTPDGIVLGGYQQMVRSEIFRGRYRDSYETSKPFVPGEVTEVEIPLQDVFHTFEAGHRVMVQVQSTWFPLFDRNPQTFVENIFEAEAADFVRATQRVYHAPANASYLEFRSLR